MVLSPRRDGSPYATNYVKTFGNFIALFKTTARSIPEKYFELGWPLLDLLVDLLVINLFFDSDLCFACF